MATQEKTWNVANRLHSQKDSDNPEVNHIIAGADEIYDDTKGAKQSDINAQTDVALDERYTKSETYSKEQLDSLITTPDVNYVTVATFSDLPQTGEANTIYRVSSYDGTQVDASKYALYAWNGTTYQLLAVRSAVGEVFDVSEYNSGATYETLTAAIAAVPASVQRGGMSIKFILRTNTGTEEEPVYHDEYVLYRLMNTDWSTVITDWQGVDEEPIAGSHNLVMSGGVYNDVMYFNNIIYGTQAIIKSATSTQNGYNVCLFDSPLAAGSVITAISRSKDTMQMYMVDMSGNLDSSVNYDAIADHLPYTTTKAYKGASIDTKATLTLTIGENVPGLEDRVTALEENEIEIDTQLLPNATNTKAAGAKAVVDLVAPIQEEIDGTQATIKSATSTQNGYNVCLFDSPLAAGSVITAISRSKDTMQMYMVDMSGNLDSSVNYDAIADHLPYTTTKAYKGASIDTKATLTLTIGENVPGLEGRLTTLEERATAIEEEITSFRKSIFIRKTDTEIEILNKMISAFNAGNVDVFWQKGVYEFSEVYIYMRDTLNWGWTMGLPIGKNCRYYFNGSTLISNAPSSSYTQERNILDCKAIGTSFEIYDAELINNDGTYCVHDETNCSKTPYHHLYRNIIMRFNGTIQQSSGMRCIGCGVGYNGEIILDGCDFFLRGTAADAFAVHGPTDNSQSSEQLNLKICISNCYVNNTEVIYISSTYFIPTKDVVYLRIANCKAHSDIISETAGVATTLIRFNNTF